MPSKNEIEAAERAVATAFPNMATYRVGKIVRIALDAAEAAFVQEATAGFDDATLEEFKQMEAAQSDGQSKEER